MMLQLSNGDDEGSLWRSRCGNRRQQQQQPVTRRRGEMHRWRKVKGAVEGRLVQRKHFPQ